MDKNCSCRCGPFKVSLIPPGILKPLILKILENKPLEGFETAGLPINRDEKEGLS